MSGSSGGATCMYQNGPTHELCGRPAAGKYLTAVAIGGTPAGVPVEVDYCAEHLEELEKGTVNQEA